MSDNSVGAINARLKNAGVPVRVRQNGGRLILRATLPIRPGDSGEGRKRYELSLGISLNREGLRRIEIEAQKLGGLITLGQFSWESYRKKPEDEPEPIGKLVQRFKDAYMTENQIAEFTWRETWQRTLDRLPQDVPLREALILGVVLSTESHTRIREQTCQRLQKFCEFAGLEIDLKPHKGRYGDAAIEPRDLPTDDLIVQWRDKIPNPQWQWTYGMIAAFGLRPHEVFFCEFADRSALEVLKGKTGHRITRAIPPEWVKEWGLEVINPPPVTGRIYRDYGQRTYRQFKRYGIPFNPYDLRHAWAIRASVVKRLPYSVAAAMMGHSVAVHTNTYHRWLSEATNEQVYRSIILEEP